MYVHEYGEDQPRRCTGALAWSAVPRPSSCGCLCVAGGGGSGSAAAAGDQPQRRVLGTGRERSAPGPLFPPPAGRAAARSSAEPGRQRRPVPGGRGAGAARPGLGGRRSRGARSAGGNKRSVTRCAQRDRPSAPLRPGSAALPRLGCRWRGSPAASARGAPRMPRETAREHLTWADKGAGPRLEARGAAPAARERGGARGSAHRSALEGKNGLSLSRQNKKCNPRIERAPTLPLHSGFVSGGSLPSPRFNGVHAQRKEKPARRKGAEFLLQGLGGR